MDNQSGGNTPIDADTRRSAWLFALYRVFVAAVLLLLGLFPDTPLGLHLVTPQFYAVIATAYLAFALVAAAFAWRCTHNPDTTSLTRIALIGGAGDGIGLIALLIVSGGVGTGIGLLLVPALVAAVLLSSARFALTLAAIATLALLLAEGVSALFLHPADTAITQAGLLGATLFAAGLLARQFARRAGETRAQVERQEVDLANLAELNAQIIARMSAGVIAVDPDGYIRSINEAARRLLPPRPGRHLSSLSPSVARVIRDWQRNGMPTTSQQLPGDRNQPALRIRLAPLGDRGDQGSLLILEDAAELQRQAQAGKLQALGRLTASIAHEIRNPLGAISHSAQLLGESPDLKPHDQRLLDIINNQSKRVNELISNVLSLSRRDAGGRERLNLQETLDRFAEEFCGALQLPRETLHARIEPADSEIQFDPSQLNQILWNLCSNARIHGGHDQPDSPPIVLRGGAGQVARVVSLDVIDAGPGISAEQEKDLFEPFVSGRAGGTGLGLYISRMLCENNGASLEYVHTPIGGCFRILFAPLETDSPKEQGA
ncbi:MULTISPECIES: PAS domain-containing sensor histidine kinase [unclassified Thioalkalivibrio]|uniref:sensor histidine kinase n=1 Tax=unclassified Thioalkalivibrio TaxID=2621013 RepID=UPI000364B34B|nr:MULTISPECIES: histidine kinase dimerization/phospho-acceptor domain-containing protein [unclassified Thioalkalivibrio]